MLRRIDAAGFVGIALVVLGLVYFVVGRADPAHSNIWRDWLLAFVLVMVGGVLAIAWALVRLSGIGTNDSEEEKEAKPNTVAKVGQSRS